jgi:hypothetical protein
MLEVQRKIHRFTARKRSFTNSAIRRSFEMKHGDRIVAIGRL